MSWFTYSNALSFSLLSAAYAVDPLFHQTSAQFDEGGAKGLHLHNLSVFRGCEILFDSEEVPQRVMAENKPLQTTPQPTIDLSSLEGV